MTMLGKLLILILTLSCFMARFHCALEQGGVLAECCDMADHQAPGSDDHCDGCPDFESSSTVIAGKAPGLDSVPFLFNLWATRQLSADIQTARPATTRGLAQSIATHRVLMGPREAIASHTTSLRGPPVQA